MKCIKQDQYVAEAKDEADIQQDVHCTSSACMEK